MATDSQMHQTMATDSQVRQNYAKDSEDGVNKQVNMELCAMYTYLSMVSAQLKRGAGFFSCFTQFCSHTVVLL